MRYIAPLDFYLRDADKFFVVRNDGVSLMRPLKTRLQSYGDSMGWNLCRLLMGISLFFSLGCTRDEGSKDDKSRIQIALPLAVEGMRAKASALSLTATSKLVHVSISVNGEGMPTLLTEWDYCRSCLQAPPPPTEFPVDVPSGKSRLFQVLAVYEDSAAKEMSIYYGDSTLDLNGGEVSLPISMTKISAGTLVQGRVAGRYLTSATSGPTGVVAVRYYPSNGKPPMLVTREEIIGGYFNFFMLSGASLEYSVNGQVLWGGPVSLDSTVFATSDRVMKAYVPVHVRSRFENGATTFYQQEARILVWGYWGEPAVSLSSKYVCSVSLGGTSLVLRQFSNSNLASSPSLTFAYTAQSAPPTPPTVASLVNTASPLSSIAVQGGAATGSNCYSYGLPNPAEEFKSIILVKKAWIDSEDQEQFAGFQKFLQFQNSLSLVTLSDYTNASINYKALTIRFLPELASLIPKVRVFKSTVLSGAGNYIDRPFCPAIASGENGFVPASSILNHPTGGAVQLTINSTLTQAEATQGASLVICALDSLGAPLPLSGHFLPSWIFGGGGSGSTMADQLLIEGPNNMIIGNYAFLGQCSPIHVRGTRNGVPAPFPSGASIGLPLTVPASSVLYPTYLDCVNNTNALSTSFQLNRGGSEDVFYVKSSSGTELSNINFTFTRNIPGMPASQQFITMNFINSVSSPLTKIKMRLPTSISAHECYPLAFWSWEDGLHSGSLRSAAKAINSTVDLATPSADLYYYSDPGCMTALGGTTGISTFGKALIFFKYKGNLTTLNLTPTIATPGGATLTGTNPILTIAQPQPPARLSIELPMNLIAGCYPFRVASQDAFGRLSPMGANPETVNLAVTNASAGEGFATDSGCSAPSNSMTVSIPIYSTHAPVMYFKVTTAGMSRTIVGTSATLGITGSVIVTSPPP